MFEPENIEDCADKLYQIYKNYGENVFLQKMEVANKRPLDFDISLMIDGLEKCYNQVYNDYKIDIVGKNNS